MTSFLSDVQNRLFVFVRKNRKLGRIYVQKVVEGRVTAKCYYSEFNWTLDKYDSKYYLMQHMKRIYRMARGLGVVLDESTNIMRVLNSKTILVFRLPHR